MLTVSNLEIERAGECLVRHLNFQLNPGQLLQITGENGSGKTSLLRTLCGFLPARRGKISWRGELIAANLDHFREQVIYIGHQAPITPQLTVFENCRYRSAIFADGCDLSTLIDKIGLAKQTHQAAGSLSAGQQRRLGFSPLLLANRPLWILDEPFNALDVAGMEWLQNMMEAHVRQAGSVIFTSHQTVSMQNVSSVVLTR